jgi:phosphonate transport system substrate-binding protein
MLNKLLAGIAICLLASSCGVQSTKATGNRPEVLRLAYNPSSDDVQQTNQRYQMLREYLQKELAIPVEMVVAAGYGATVEAMRARKIDAATMGPMSYLLAAEKANAEAIAIPGTNQGPGTYQSCIIVRADSPIKTIDELIQGGGKYTFSFVDPASTSGHLIPRAYLESRDIVPEKHFRKLHFANQHVTNVYTVLGGKVDAGATMPAMITNLLSRGKVKEGELRTLWESKPIPQSPVCMRKDLPAAFRQDVQKAFLNMHTKAPGLAESFLTVTKRPPGVTHFQYYPATDASYDGLREIARGVKSMKMIE